MGKMQRTKGAAGEREFAGILNDTFPLETGRRVGRNLEQTQQGGHDLVALPGVAIEVKRQETLALNKWWEQAVDQANKCDLLPVLAYRQNRKPWRIAIPIQLVENKLCGFSIGCSFMEMDINGFAYFYRRYVAQEITDEDLGPNDHPSYDDAISASRPVER